MLEQLDHINIVVTDLQRMTAFYRDLLGLKVTKQVTITGPWIDHVVGLTNALADVVYLDFPTGPRLELIQYQTPTAPRPQNLDQSNTPGLRHFALRVSNIDELVATLRSRGVNFLSQIQQVPDTQVTYANNIHKRLVYFRDPEGNLLELCEYRSASP